MSRALVIGGGPAGLMAAEALLTAGVPTVLVEAKPSIGRKFLMAGKSGLNLTSMEPLEPFLAHYDASAPALAPMVRAFSPEALRDWAEGLGQDTFAGSTGRLFPKAMKASPLLRAWLARLDGMGLERRARWHWRGWDDFDCLFDTPDGPQRITPSVTVLALGGGSWARLGSDGLWRDTFAGAGLPSLPFAPSNAAISVPWTDHMPPHFGTPIKAVQWRAGSLTSRGEAVLSPKGLEGGGIYPLSPAIRAGEELFLDLAPDLDHAKLLERILARPGKLSIPRVLRNVLRLPPVKIALYHEFAPRVPMSSQDVAGQIKALRIRHAGLRPLDEAISTTGGVPWGALDDGLMLRDRPGVFCAGEMIDWDAPTGGYLLTACMATGLWAGRHAADWVSARS